MAFYVPTRRRWRWSWTELRFKNIYHARQDPRGRPRPANFLLSLLQPSRST
jgi:hypothetical protein